jgi:hypothetical protein
VSLEGSAAWATKPAAMSQMNAMPIRVIKLSFQLAVWIAQP